MTENSSKEKAEVDKSKKKEVISETFLKNRKKYDRERQIKKANKIADLKKRKFAHQKTFKRAEKYALEYLSEEKAIREMKKSAKMSKNLYVEPESKIILAVRIRGVNKVPSKIRTILNLLRLRQINNAVFIKANKSSLKLLRLVEKFIAYGYPNIKTIKNLVYKRGCVKINKQRIPIYDNEIIENNLGKHDIICIEDIIHEIFVCGTHFKEVNNFLWPFKLNSAKGGLKNVKIHFNESGDYGNREELINKLVMRMI